MTVVALLTIKLIIFLCMCACVYMCACAVCTAKGTLSQLHCAITKLETCKKLFFICTVHTCVLQGCALIRLCFS